MTQFGSYQEAIEILEELFLHHVVLRDATIINLCIQKLEAAQNEARLAYEHDMETHINAGREAHTFDVDDVVY